MTGRDLSVVMPCHNGGKYLSEAIESVLRQESRVGSLEIVVVDDRSNDEETLDLLESWRRHGEPVRVLANRGKRGPGGARNTGVAAAAGAWVAFLDADDIWLPGGLQARWEVVASRAGTEWVGADFQEWYQDGSVEKAGHYQRDDFAGRTLAPAYRSGAPLVLERPVGHFLRSSLTWIGTVLVKRTLFERVGGFDPALCGPEDLHLWYRLALRADFLFVPRVVALYRQHPESLIHRFRRTGRLGPQWDALYRSLRSDPAFRRWRRDLKENLAAVHDGQARADRADGEYGRAAAAALRALSYAPLRTRAWRHLLGALLMRGAGRHQEE